MRTTFNMLFSLFSSIIYNFKAFIRNMKFQEQVQSFASPETPESP